MKKISILMGAYNSSSTIAEAIDSILNQTYVNWELIVCDDGSSDDTRIIVQEYREKYPEKIVLIVNDHNMGLNKTLNHCLQHASGEYIARMDADDISLPERLEKEYDFLEENPRFDIVSTPMIYFDENGEWGRGNAIEFPDKLSFVRGTPFCHAPCMIRKEAILSVNGYSEDSRTIRSEDYDLWFRLYEAGFLGANLQEPYYMMRDDINAYHRRKFIFCLNEAYVRFTGYRRLKLPIWTMIYALRPVIVGGLPKGIYLYLHHRKKR